MSKETDSVTTKFQAKTGMSRGKAFNYLIRKGLEAEGFLDPPLTTQQKEDLEKEKQWNDDYALLSKNWTTMNEKVRDFYYHKWPQHKEQLNSLLSKELTVEGE